MATSITIRNVPDEIHAELCERARINGQSLQEYLLAQLINLAKRPDVKVWLARLEAEKLLDAVNVSSDQILDIRDRERP